MPYSRWLNAHWIFYFNKISFFYAGGWTKKENNLSSPKFILFLCVRFYKFPYFCCCEGRNITITSVMNVSSLSHLKFSFLYHFYCRSLGQNIFNFLLSRFSFSSVVVFFPHIWLSKFRELWTQSFFPFVTFVYDSNCVVVCHEEGEKKTEKKRTKGILGRRMEIRFQRQQIRKSFVTEI